MIFPFDDENLLVILNQITDLYIRFVYYFHNLKYETLQCAINYYNQ